MTRRAVPQKPGRDAYWEQLGKLLTALLDAPLAISSASIEVVQHRGEEQFYGYIVLRAGEINQTRYDAIREVVNTLGGSVSIADFDKIERGNIRIWPFDPDARRA